MTSTKFEVSMEIFKFQGEPDVSVTLTGKSPTELDTALKTLETIAKTTTLYNGDSAPEAEKSVTSEPKQEAPVVSTADKKAPPEKPVSWLPPLPQRKGLMLLRCPKCKNEFVQFLREPQTTNECRKCGAKIPLDALGANACSFRVGDCVMGMTVHSFKNLMSVAARALRGGADNAGKE